MAVRLILVQVWDTRRMVEKRLILRRSRLCGLMPRSIQPHIINTLKNDLCIDRAHRQIILDGIRLSTNRMRNLTFLFGDISSKNVCNGNIHVILVGAGQCHAHLTHLHQTG
ncbi:hypothetical protein ACHAXS_010370, partial [Conticribra weissflogii]